MTPESMTAAPATPFTMLGDSRAAVCVGDVCEIPQAFAGESEQAIVNRKLDEDLV